MEGAALGREDLLRLLMQRESELAAAHEERRDKDAAISFLKTRIVTMQNQSRASSNGGGSSGGIGGEEMQQPGELRRIGSDVGDREQRLEAELRRQQEVNRRLALQLERSTQDAETLQRRLSEAREEITFLWRELHGREAATMHPEDAAGLALAAAAAAVPSSAVARPEVVRQQALPCSPSSSSLAVAPLAAPLAAQPPPTSDGTPAGAEAGAGARPWAHARPSGATTPPMGDGGPSPASWQSEEVVPPSPLGSPSTASRQLRSSLGGDAATPDGISPGATELDATPPLLSRAAELRVPADDRPLTAAPAAGAALAPPALAEWSGFHVEHPGRRVDGLCQAADAGAGAARAARASLAAAGKDRTPLRAAGFGVGVEALPSSGSIADDPRGPALGLARGGEEVVGLGEDGRPTAVPASSSLEPAGREPAPALVAVAAGAPKASRMPLIPTAVICIGFDNQEADKASMDAKRLRVAKQLEKRQQARTSAADARKCTSGSASISSGRRGGDDAGGSAAASADPAAISEAALWAARSEEAFADRDVAAGRAGPCAAAAAGVPTAAATASAAAATAAAAAVPVSARAAPGLLHSARLAIGGAGRLHDGACGAASPPGATKPQLPQLPLHARAPGAVAGGGAASPVAWELGGSPSATPLATARTDRDAGGSTPSGVLQGSSGRSTLHSRFADLRDEMKRRRSNVPGTMGSGDAQGVAEAVIADANAAADRAPGAASPGVPMGGFSGGGRASLGGALGSPRGSRSASSLPPSPKSSSSTSAPPGAKQASSVAPSTARGVGSAPASNAFVPAARVKSSNTGPSPNERIITTTVVGPAGCGGAAQATNFFLSLGGTGGGPGGLPVGTDGCGVLSPSSTGSPISPETYGRQDAFFPTASAVVVGSGAPSPSPRIGGQFQSLVSGHLASARQRLTTQESACSTARSSAGAASGGQDELSRSRRMMMGSLGGSGRPSASSSATPLGVGLGAGLGPALPVGGGGAAPGSEGGELDPVHEAVARYCLQRPTGRFPMVRHSRGVYLYGNKKLVIALHNDKLMVRIGGGGFVNVETYLIDADRGAAGATHPGAPAPAGPAATAASAGLGPASGGGAGIAGPRRSARTVA